MDKTVRYDCNNPDDQVTIADMHQIGADTFNDYLVNFWGAQAAEIEPTTKTWVELSNAMAGQDCSSMQWKLQMDPNDLGNNTITLSIIPSTETIVNYSIALFKGVRKAYNAENFHFYKARHADDRYDIVFKCTDAGGAVVYYGDLSDLHP